MKTNFISRYLIPALRIAALAIFMIVAIGYAPNLNAFAAPVNETADLTSSLVDSNGIVLLSKSLGTNACFETNVRVPREHWNKQHATLPVYDHTYVDFVATNWKPRGLPTESFAVSGNILTIDTGSDNSGGLSADLLVVYCADVNAKTRDQVGLGVMPVATPAMVDWAAYGDKLEYDPDPSGRHSIWYNGVKLTSDGTSLSNIPIGSDGKVTAFLGPDSTTMVVNLGTCNTSPCTWNAPSGTTFAEQGFGMYILFRIEAKDPNAIHIAGSRIGILGP